MKTEFVRDRMQRCLAFSFFICLVSATCKWFHSEKLLLFVWTRSVVANVFTLCHKRINGCRWCETRKITKQVCYVARGKSNLFRWNGTNGRYSLLNRRKTYAENRFRKGKLWKVLRHSIEMIFGLATYRSFPFLVKHFVFNWFAQFPIQKFYF